MIKSRKLTALVTIISLILINSIPVKAVSSKEIDDDPQVIDIESDNSITTYYFSDDTKIIDNGSTYTIIVPEYASEYTPPQSQGRGAVAGTIWAVISTAMTACQIIEWTFGENPCEIAYKYLLKVVTRPRTGKYKVGSVYHQGYIPGCEPRNSLPCNSGYYEYTFIPM